MRSATRFGWMVLPLLALIGCGVESGERTGEAVTDDASLKSAFTYTTGGERGPVVRSAVELSDESVILTTGARRLQKLTPQGVLDPAFSSDVVFDVDEKRGFHGLYRAWPDGKGHVLTPLEEPTHQFEIATVFSVARIRTSDGKLDPAFGTNGVVQLPKLTNPVTGDPGRGGLAINYDRTRGVLDVVVVKEWQLVWNAPQAPRTIEILEIDAETGATTSKGTHTFPTWVQPWTSSDTSVPRQTWIKSVYREPDGSYLLLAHELLNDEPAHVRVEDRAKGEWFTIKLSANAPPTRARIATGVRMGLVSAVQDAGGALDVILKDSFDAFDGTAYENKIVRFTVDASGAPTAATVIDDVPQEFAAATMAGPDLLVARDTPEGLAFTRYVPDGARTESSLGMFGGVHSLDIGPSGALYLGLKAQVSHMTWKYSLSKLTP